MDRPSHWHTLRALPELIQAPAREAGKYAIYQPRFAVRPNITPASGRVAAGRAGSGYYSRSVASISCRVLKFERIFNRTLCFFYPV